MYRHLARIDNTYRDVGPRLRRLLDAERAKSEGGPRAAGAPRAAGCRPPAPAVPAGAPGAAAEERGSGGRRARRATRRARPQRLGRYQLEREIGRGAMGIVYLGRDTAINRLVAIKAIPLATEFSESELAEARARFFREAETAGRLNHPNIVTIYDVGEERGLAYIAMEYLKGRHLSDYATLRHPARAAQGARSDRAHGAGARLRAQAAGGASRYQTREHHVRSERATCSRSRTSVSRG